MMNTQSAVKMLIICAIGIVTLPVFGDTAGQGKSMLPGARPAIEAIHYPTLQAALDALPPNGGKVLLPVGTFKITEPLILTQEDVSIEGCGTATHINNVNTEGKPALILRPLSLAMNPKAYQWRVRLANLRITGNEKSGHGIFATNVDELFIDGVTISYHGGDGVRLVNCYEDPRICNSLITYNKCTGLHLIQCHDIVVAANQFEENYDALRCTDSFNLTMTGNNLDDHLGDGVVIENTYGSVISGNMIEECQGTAVVLDRDTYGTTVSANVIAHNVSGGVDLRDAHGCSVSANTFTIVRRNALVIGSDSGRITVTGNNFSDSYVGAGAVKRDPDDIAASGLFLFGASSVTVTGNLFSGLSSKAVTIGGPKPSNILFTDNVLTDVQSDHKRLRRPIVRHNLESASD